MAHRGVGRGVGVYWVVGLLYFALPRLALLSAFLVLEKGGGFAGCETALVCRGACLPSCPVLSCLVRSIQSDFFPSACVRVLCVLECFK